MILWGLLIKTVDFFLGDTGHVEKDFSIKFVVNCSLAYGKSPMEHYNVKQHVQHINVYFQNQCSVRKTFCILHTFIHAHPSY